MSDACGVVPNAASPGPKSPLAPHRKGSSKRKKKRSPTNTALLFAPSPDVWQAKHAYAAVDAKELSVAKGALVRVLKQSASGWWKCQLVEDATSIGRVPCTFLAAVTRRPAPFARVHNVARALLHGIAQSVALGTTRRDAIRLVTLLEAVADPLRVRFTAQLSTGSTCEEWQDAMAQLQASAARVVLSTDPEAAVYALCVDAARLMSHEHEVVAPALWRCASDAIIEAACNEALLVAAAASSRVLEWPEWLTCNPPHEHGAILAAASAAAARSAPAVAYHVIVSYACPWSARVLVARALLGLESRVSVSVVSPRQRGGEWVFDARGRHAGTADACDGVFGCTTLEQVYQRAVPPSWNQRVSLPLLLDCNARSAVSNSSVAIVRLLCSLACDSTLRPVALERRIDAVVTSVEEGVYACFAAHKAAACAEDKERHAALFANMAKRVDATLSRHRYLAGSALTEADVFCLGFFAQIDNYLLSVGGLAGPTLAELPNVRAWMADVCALRPELRQCASLWASHMTAFAARNLRRAERAPVPLDLSVRARNLSNGEQ